MKAIKSSDLNIEIKTSLFNHLTIRQDREMIHLTFADAEALANSILALIKLPAGQTEEITSTLRG